MRQSATATYSSECALRKQRGAEVVDLPRRSLLFVAEILGLFVCGTVQAQSAAPPAAATVIFSTYLGSFAGGVQGQNADQIYAAATDSTGATYVTGIAGAGFPLLNAIQSTNPGIDYPFLTKLSPSGAIVYSTYLTYLGAGPGMGAAVAVDSTGAAYVSTTGGVIYKVSPTGGQILWQKELRFGASSIPTTHATLRVDAQDNLIVSGVFGFNGASSSTFRSFISKLDAAGVLLWEFDPYALLQRSGPVAPLVDVDASGYVYAAMSSSPTVIATDMILGAPVDGEDVFVLRLSPSGLLTNSTLLGGGANDFASDIAVAPDGEITILGGSSSADFPTSTDALQRVWPGTGGWPFVSKLRLGGGGASLSSSTFLPYQSIHKLARLPNGDVALAGNMDPTRFQPVNALSSEGNLAFIRLSSDLSSARFATQFGGPFLGGLRYGQTPYGLVAGPDGSVTMVGTTMQYVFPTSATFPTQYPSVQTVAPGFTDGFVVKFSGVSVTPPPLDSDSDTIPDSTDKCPNIANTDQADLDGDQIGDACDTDIDGDEVQNSSDPAPDIPEPDTSRVHVISALEQQPPNCTPGPKSLVLVVHGWLPSSLGPLSANDWPAIMAGELRNEVATNLPTDVCNWDFKYLDWWAKAFTNLPATAFSNGGNVADQVYAQIKNTYSHVHLIAHSAGSNVIDELTKQLVAESVRPTVQETFLDAYNPNGNKNDFGCKADWAESYVDMRPAVSNWLNPIGNTNLTLTGALNIDVTATKETNWPPGAISLNGSPPLSLEMIAYHAWPYEWYSETIAANPAQYGFALSLESGRVELPSHGADGSGTGRGWRMCLDAFGQPYSCPAITTGPEPLGAGLCKAEMQPIDWGKAIAEWLGIPETSSTGTIYYEPTVGEATVFTGSPAWIRFTLNVPQAVDALQFTYEFLRPSPADGVLTVIVDNQLVYSRQQSFSKAGALASGIVPLGNLEQGKHSVTFRLDPTTAAQAGVKIAGIDLGIVDLSEPAVIAPTVSPSIAAASGANGWYTSDAALSWTLDGIGLPITSQSGCDPTTVTTDTLDQTFTCTATSAGGTTSESVTIKRDATPPVATATPSPLPNANGWHNGNVTVQFTGTDATSGIASCTANQSLTAEGAAQGATGTCTDNAGNVSAPVTISDINIDKSAPIVQATAAPSPNGTGWNTSPVTVSFTATDAASGVAPDGCDAPVTLSTDGSDQSVTGSCQDRAGNSASATSSNIRIDRTAPTVAGSRTPDPNPNGWNNTNVTATFAGTDSLSGSGLASCTAPQTLSAEGQGLSAAGTCTDAAGNTSPPATVGGINIDKTAPSVSIATPPNGASYSSGAPVSASYSCSDSVSGTASCVGTVPDGAPVDTGGGGSKSFAVNASDNAGNSASASTSYTVGSTPSDTTAPSITPNIIGVAGSDNWYRSDIQVSWSVTDAESAVSATNGCAATSITSDTNGVTLTCSATSGGGTATGSITVKRDTGRPASLTLSPLSFIRYPRNSRIPAVYGCYDTRSGIAECRGTVKSGALIDTATVGEKSFTVTAVDKAGNMHNSVIRYQVR
jgi:hypothetical protein